MEPNSVPHPFEFGDSREFAVTRNQRNSARDGAGSDQPIVELADVQVQEDAPTHGTQSRQPTVAARADLIFDLLD